MAAAFVHKSHLLHDRERKQKIQDQSIKTMLQGGKASLKMKFMKRGRGTCCPTLSTVDPWQGANAHLPRAQVPWKTDAEQRMTS